MKTYLVIKIPVQIPADLINATSEKLANGVVDNIRSFVSGESAISFETVGDEIILENVKVHTPLPARASVDHGVEVESTQTPENRAADRVCVSRLVRLLFIRLLMDVKSSPVAYSDFSDEEREERETMTIDGVWWDEAIINALDETEYAMSPIIREKVITASRGLGHPCNTLPSNHHRHPDSVESRPECPPQ